MPATERMMEVPAFSIGNISFSGGFVSENLEYLGTNKPAYELSVGSLTHADQSALYMLGLFAKIELDNGAQIVDAHKETKHAALQHYDAVHANTERGNWNFDSIDYDMEAPANSGLFLPKGYETLAWIKRPVFEKRNGVWQPVFDESRGSELIFADMPPDGYGPRPTHDGLRSPKTGWALATSPDRNLVIRELADYFSKFVDERAAKEIAKREVSYSFRRQHGSGKSAVFRGCDLGGGGPFDEDASWSAGDGVAGLGAFPSRSSVKE
ncbi:MAG: hypothetical protein HY517_02790 [Candidatus Aenigmarchaeota archaeon]|nr:hypothetical protein [Candidatus Aenigmarchaeota archaeon]